MKIKQFAILCIIAFVVASCNLPDQSDLTFAGSERAWIDAPLDGSLIALEGYEIVYHGAAPEGVSYTELSINSQPVSLLDHSGQLEPIQTIHFNWLPTEPGEYIIQARTQTITGEWSEYASVRVTVGMPQPTAEPVIAPENTPTVEAVASPTVCSPTATLLVESNCRTGPGLDYQILTSLSAGQMVPIEGRDQYARWWWVNPPALDDHCWVSDASVDTTCISADIAQIEVPPLIMEPTYSTPEFYWGERCDLRVVTIEVVVTANTTISFVEIHYRVKDQPWEARDMQLVGDNIYRIQLYSDFDIPGADSQTSSPLYYYILAEDTGGLSSATGIFDNIVLSKCP